MSSHGEANIIAAAHVFPAQPGFYALYSTDCGEGLRVAPIIAWKVSAWDRVSAITPDGDDDYDAVEYPDGEVLRNEFGADRVGCETWFESREDYHLYMAEGRLSEREAREQRAAHVKAARTGTVVQFPTMARLLERDPAVDPMPDEDGAERGCTAPTQTAAGMPSMEED